MRNILVEYVTADTDEKKKAAAEKLKNSGSFLFS